MTGARIADAAPMRQATVPARAGLPRLLYIADVPVEASYHGSALVYRLLDDYPKERLLIVEAGLHASEPQRRLGGVRYVDRRLPLLRLHRTRFWQTYTAIALRTAELRARRLARLVADVRPEAVLSVTHGYSFLTAARIARDHRLPLHLICHDEWADTAAGAGDTERRHRLFGEAYRQAVSRLCVSPFMAEEYERRYGATGAVLYPSRAADALRYDAPPARLASGRTGPFTCVFAGTVNSQGAADALKALAAALAPVGGRLLVHGPLDAGQARASGLDAANVELGGLVSSGRLMEILRERADALFVPMSFSAADRPNMELSFPSKLTDYTAVGVPLLIYGPEYCSAVRWARENAGVADVVTEQTGLAPALSQLVGDAGHRLSLARAALEVGEKYFSHAAALSVFQAALRGATVRARG